MLSVSVSPLVNAYTLDILTQPRAGLTLDSLSLASFEMPIPLSLTSASLFFSLFPHSFFHSGILSLIL